MHMSRFRVLTLGVALISLTVVTASPALPPVKSAAASDYRAAVATAKATSTPVPTATPVPQVLVVTTTADIAPCPKGSGNPGFSLRCAMGLANSVGSGRQIAFNIPASDPGCHPTAIGTTSVPVCTISLTRTLNLTANSTTIAGYTQPGSSPSTRSLTGADDNAVLTIQLDGTSMFAGGIALSSTTGDTIRGISMTNFHNGPAISTTQTNNTVIEGSFIGVAPGGAVQGNAEGIRLTQVHETTIGGSTPAARNRVSGSAGFGIAASQYGLGVMIQGNLISENGTSGIGIGTDAQGIAIPVQIRENIITKNAGLGIDISPGAVSNCQVFAHYASHSTPCPVIHKVTARAVSGTACKGCVVELYRASAARNDGGFGETSAFLGRVVATKGTWRLSLTGKHVNPAHQQVTATATSAGDSPATSEFALNMPVRLQLKSRKSHYLVTKGRLVGVSVTWRMAGQVGITGFDVYAGAKRLNSRLIPVATPGTYALKAPLTKKAAITLAVTLENGVRMMVAVPAA